MLSVPQLIQQAVQLHSAGKFAEAEQLYLKALDRAPNEPAALHLFGVLRHQQGRNTEAVELVRRAVRLNPNDADAHVNLTSICRAIGDADGAIAAGKRATQLAPNSPEAWNNLALALKMKKQPGDALSALQRALQLRPNYPEGVMNYGNTLYDLGRHDEAIAVLQSLVRARPTAAVFHNLGLALRAAKRQNEAIDAFAHAAQLDPRSADFLATLGDAFQEALRYDEAIDAYRRALAIDANLARVFNNFGVALRETGKLADAVSAHRKSVELQPESADAHFHLALTLLEAGKYTDGWREHEWRWKSTDFTSAPRDFTQPVWDGKTELAGRTILVHAEQGFGDTLQFVRYAPLLADRGAKVIVETQPALLRLLKSLRGVDQVIARGDGLPEFDVRIPMMSLPCAFVTTLETIPTTKPYLQPIPADVDRWRERISKGAVPGELKIGLAWAGNPNRQLDEQRSISLKMLSPLAEMPNARFFSLQKLAGAEQAASPPAGMTLIDFTRDLFDFADTAALVTNLDLVITVDTAAAHLAGALGKPVWVMLPFAGGWRWLSHRTDSPWYPTARLFRQPVRGDWNSVIRNVATALRSEFKADLPRA